MHSIKLSHFQIGAIACLGLMLLVTLVSGQSALAHPDDEFCAISGGMDPLLCEALAEIDRAGPITTHELLVSTDRTLLENTLYFIRAGVDHILPGGIDHILFVLALFFGVRKLRPLAVQISIFTLAHTATLALASLELIYATPDIVEPLIAASIAFVAIENILLKKLMPWRPLIVMAFGLLHGMGFAGFFLDQDLPDGFFFSSLIGFNIGVEIGQISVVLAAFLLLNWFFNKDWYHRFVALPASLIIGGIGLWWAIERVFF